jgi:hypothetical protein
MTTLAQHVGQVSAKLESRNNVIELAATTRHLMLARGDTAKAAALAKDDSQFAGPRVVHVLQNSMGEVSHRGLRTKAAVDSGATLSSSWGSPLAVFESQTNAFLNSLSATSAFDAMWPFMRQFPLRTRIVYSTTAIVGAGTAEASAKVLGRASLSSADLDAVKATAQFTVSDELLRFNQYGTTFLETELRTALTRAANAVFLPLLVAGASFVSSGSTANAIRQDLRTLLSAMNNNANRKLFLIVPTIIAEAWSTIGDSAGGKAFTDVTVNGGSAEGIPIIMCDEATSGEIILVDASQIAAGQEGIVLDATKEASLQFDSAPDSPTSASTNLVSLWQNDLAALRAERYIGAKVLRSDSVAKITGANYTGSSP